jgi:hypothetical protein
MPKIWSEIERELFGAIGISSTHDPIRSIAHHKHNDCAAGRDCRYGYGR